MPHSDVDAVFENDAAQEDDDHDALLTAGNGDGMSGGDGSGGVGGVATAATTVRKVFGMLCFWGLLQLLVGIGRFGVSGLELGRLCIGNILLFQKCHE